MGELFSGSRGRRGVGACARGQEFVNRHEGGPLAAFASRWRTTAMPLVSFLAIGGAQPRVRHQCVNAVLRHARRLRSGDRARATVRQHASTRQVRVTRTGRSGEATSFLSFRRIDESAVALRQELFTPLAVLSGGSGSLATGVAVELTNETIALPLGELSAGARASSEGTQADEGKGQRLHGARTLPQTRPQCAGEFIPLGRVRWSHDEHHAGTTGIA
jgi:hypothetical protein